MSLTKNRFPINCFRCHTLVEVKTGYVYMVKGRWQGEHKTCRIKNREEQKAKQETQLTLRKCKCQKKGNNLICQSTQCRACGNCSKWCIRGDNGYRC